jgi:hypothetical protein
VRLLTAPHALIEPARPDSVIGPVLGKGPMVPENGTAGEALAGAATASEWQGLRGALCDLATEVCSCLSI